MYVLSCESATRNWKVITCSSNFLRTGSQNEDLPKQVIFPHLQGRAIFMVDSSWHVMVHSDAREGKWRGTWRMECLARTLHTTSEHGVLSITTADTHTSLASSRLNWRLRRFKWTRPFRRKMKSGFCTCALTFQLASNTELKQQTGSLRRHSREIFKAVF